MPNKTRMNSRTPKAPTKPVKPQDSDHSVKQPAYNQRNRARSAAQPMGSCITAYDQKKAESNTPLAAGPRCKSAAITGIAMERMARSR